MLRLMLFNTKQLVARRKTRKYLVLFVTYHIEQNICKLKHIFERCSEQMNNKKQSDKTHATSPHGTGK